MWILESNSKPDERYPILGDKKYVVGRVGCDIIINDPSVSRKQAVLMMAHYETNVVKSFITPSLTLEDTSKFGTSVNGESVKKKPGSVATLKEGDKIQFGGSPASIYIARYQPFVATTSCLEKIPKKDLHRVMCLLGGHMVREWRASCDLLIMAKINVTIKVICAINNQKSIVTPDYLDHLHQHLMGKRPDKPDPKDYLPEVVDKEVPAGVSFHPDIRRATLLKDLKFYFLSAHQFNKTNLAVSTAGGLPILLEDGMEEDAEEMTQDKTIVVAVSRDVLMSLSQTCQKFVRTVYLVLKKKNLRMVTDPEIGWAILTCNTDDFCNPKSAITPSMYSSMASQSLTQMTDIDEVPHTNTLNNVSHSHAHTVTDTDTQHRSPGRPGKRSADIMEKDEGVDLNKTTTEPVENRLSLNSPAPKRVKPEPTSHSQESLFASESIVPSRAGSQVKSVTASVFKSPQTPLPPPSPSVRKNELDNDDDGDESCSRPCKGSNNQSKLLNTNVNKDSGTNRKNELAESGDTVVEQECGSGSIKSNLNISSDCDSNEATSANGNLLFGGKESEIKKKALPSSSNTKSLVHRNKDSSPSIDKWIQRHDNSNTLMEDDGNVKQNSLLLSSSKGKTKKKRGNKRALFSESLKAEEDEEETVLPISSKQRRLNGSDSNTIGSDIDRVSDCNVIDDTESSVVCNGMTEDHHTSRPTTTTVVPIKVESPSQSTPAHSINGVGSVHNNHQAESDAPWASVKKEEEEEEELSEETKLRMELVLDNDGQPLRHLCTVKVVDLVARPPGTKSSGTFTPQCQQAGVKNFKRFKKTLHRGHSELHNELPTIIRGNDLEPHKSTQVLDHFEELMKDDGRSQNDGEAIFRSENDEVTTADNRRSKRK